MAEQLTASDLEVLEFERATWKYSGRKESVIRERFGYSAVRHYQRVNALIDHPAALAYDPELVRRLQRIRDQRTGQRSAAYRGVAVGGGTR